MKVERISRDELGIQIATLISLRSLCRRKRVGALITQRNRIISTGYNGSLTHHDCDKLCNIDLPCKDAVHAEANAIAFAAKEGISLKGTKLYITDSPCLECAKLIHQSGIQEVIYLQPYRDNSGVELLLKLGIKISQYNGEETTGF